MAEKYPGHAEGSSVAGDASLVVEVVAAVSGAIVVDAVVEN